MVFKVEFEFENRMLNVFKSIDAVGGTMWTMSRGPHQYGLLVLHLNRVFAVFSMSF